MDEVCSGWDRTLVNGKDRKDDLERASRTQQMARCAFGGRDRDRSATPEPADGTELDPVAHGRRRGMGVDVVDIAGLQLCLL